MQVCGLPSVIHVPRIISITSLRPGIVASTRHFLFWLLPLDSACFPSLAVMMTIAVQNVKRSLSHCLITQLSCGLCLEKGLALSKTFAHFCRTLTPAVFCKINYYSCSLESLLIYKCRLERSTSLNMSHTACNYINCNKSSYP